MSTDEDTYEWHIGSLYVFFRRRSVENPIIHCSGSLLSDVTTTPGGTTDKAYVVWMTDCERNVERLVECVRHAFLSDGPGT